MFKHFTSLLLSVTLVLSLCCFSPSEVFAETVSNSDFESNLSSVFEANLMEPAVITSDGTITAKFNIVRIGGSEAKANEKSAITYLPDESHPDLKVSSYIKNEENENGLKYINLSKSVFTVTGKLNSAVLPGTTLGILNIADHDTIETIALNLETRESFKYDYSYSSDTLKKAYLYWDPANGSTLESLLNKDVIFNPEPDFFEKNNMTYTWDKHFMCNNNTLFDKSGREFSHKYHNKHLKLYFTFDFTNTDKSMLYGINHDASVEMAFDPDNPEAMHTKYPTDYIFRDLSKSPLIIPNENGESSPLLEIHKKDNVKIKHDPASIHNNSANREIKYEWILKGDNGSRILTVTDQPSLSPESVRGIKSGEVYTITCNAVLTDLSGKTIDKMSYADTHMVKVILESKPASDPTEKPTVEPEKPVDTPDSNETVVAPNTGDNSNLDWLLLATVLMTAVLVTNYAFYHRNKKNQ